MIANFQNFLWGGMPPDPPSKSMLSVLCTLCSVLLVPAPLYQFFEYAPLIKFLTIYLVKCRHFEW